MVTTKMQAAQGLWFPEQSGEILDSWLDQSTPLQVKMYEVQVVLNEVFEARDDRLVKLWQLNLRLAINNLLRCQLGLLLLK